MNNSLSFAKILETKIQQGHSQSRTTLAQGTQEFDTSPAHLAYLLGCGTIQNRASSPKGYPRPKPKPRKAHNLNEKQKIAFDLFSKYEEPLCSGFTLNELKAAFRKLAKRLHPDHSRGSSQKFIELREAYRCLSDLSPSL